MADRQGIIDAISAALEDVKKEPAVKMYLVVETRLDDEPYVFYKIDIEGNVPGYFRNTLQKKLYVLSEEARADSSKFKSFFAVHRNAGDILYIEAADVPNLKWILDKLAQKPKKTDRFPARKEIPNLWGFMIDIETAHGKTVYFRKYTESKIIGKENEKGKWSGKLHEGRLTDVQGDVLTFDEQVDCVYFEKADAIVITSLYGRFESMFDFRDYYQKETIKVLTTLKGKFLLIEEELITKAADRIRTSQRITKLSKSGVIGDIEAKKITTYFFERTRTVINQKYKGRITYDIFYGKVGVQDMRALDSFVDACLFRYLIAPAGYDEKSDPQMFAVEYKELLEDN